VEKEEGVRPGKSILKNRRKVEEESTREERVEAYRAEKRSSGRKNRLGLHSKDLERVKGTGAGAFKY